MTLSHESTLTRPPVKPNRRKFLTREEFEALRRVIPELPALRVLEWDDRMLVEWKKYKGMRPDGGLLRVVGKRRKKLIVYLPRREFHAGWSCNNYAYHYIAFGGEEGGVLIFFVLWILHRECGSERVPVRFEDRVWLYRYRVGETVEETEL
ncbi:hypothetical protein [Palaeococcus ferrophilus]|uniref:hypothetical protein n=1 Tax=Palaeococcus ferrophilus TaxID=83868 RepID=UPI00064F7A25|nr:hypothetical protein [Palaeococcus ferrophilus]